MMWPPSSLISRTPFAAICVVMLLLPAVSMYGQDAVTSRVGAPQGRPLSGKELEKETAKVSALLRCPVCQGLAIADSPAPMAVNMRGQVRDLLTKGYSRDQILRYFESSYGEFVRLEPKREGMNLLVWILPVLGLLLGGWAIFRFAFTGSSRGVAQSEAVAPEAGLEPYLARVRQIVRGKKTVDDARG